MLAVSPASSFSIVLPNEPSGDWPRFYAENRLLQPIDFSSDVAVEKRTISTGGGPVLAIAAALFFFFAWAGTVLLVTLLLDRWRTRGPGLRKISVPTDVDFA